MRNKWLRLDIKKIGRLKKEKKERQRNDDSEIEVILTVESEIKDVRIKRKVKMKMRNKSSDLRRLYRVSHHFVVEYKTCSWKSFFLNQ